MENIRFPVGEAGERRKAWKLKAGLGREGLGEGCGVQTWQIRPDKGAVRDGGCHTITYKLIPGKTEGLCKPNILPLEKREKQKAWNHSGSALVMGTLSKKNETNKKIMTVMINNNSNNNNLKIENSCIQPPSSLQATKKVWKDAEGRMGLALSG